jgi:hypothetical protein
MRKAIPFIIASKKIHLGTNLIRVVKNFYTKTINDQRKKSKKTIRRWKDLLPMFMDHYNQ